MANRSMQAKTLKLKRQKRLFPVHLSAHYIPAGKPPNQLVMQQLKESAKGLAFDDEYAAYLVHREQLKGLYPHPGREEVKAHIKRIQDTAASLMNVVLTNTKMCKTSLFYNSERNRFVLFEDNLMENTLRTSMVYMDRSRIIAAWRSNTVRWVRFSSVRPPSN